MGSRRINSAEPGPGRVEVICGAAAATLLPLFSFFLFTALRCLKIRDSMRNGAMIAVVSFVLVVQRGRCDAVSADACGDWGLGWQGNSIDCDEKRRHYRLRL